MDITNLLSIFTNSNNVSAISKEADVEPSQVSSLLYKAIPILMKGMEQNASSTEGAASLSKALDNHALNNVEDVPSYLRVLDKEDGSKAVNHILGDKKEHVQQGLAQKSGLSTSQIGTILAAVTPMLLSLLGKHKSNNNVSSNGIGDMLSSFLGGNSGGDLGGMISSVLSDNDGDGKPDILQKLGGLFNRK